MCDLSRKKNHFGIVFVRVCVCAHSCKETKTSLFFGQMRTEYLSLMHLILKTSDYGEHMHRRQELENVLEAVMSEEGAASDMDRRIVQQIWKDFPHYFSSFV